MVEQYSWPRDCVLIINASQCEIARIRGVIEVRFDYSETLNLRQALQGAAVDMTNCNLRVHYLQLDRKVEKQLDHGEYPEGDESLKEFEEMLSFI